MNHVDILNKAIESLSELHSTAKESYEKSTLLATVEGLRQTVKRLQRGQGPTSEVSDVIADLTKLSKDHQQRIVVFVLKDLIELRKQYPNGILPTFLPSLVPSVIESARTRMGVTITPAVVGAAFVMMVDGGVLEPVTREVIDEEDPTLSYPEAIGYKLVKTTLV